MRDGRRVHLVGSIPADNPTTAMLAALQHTGGRVAALPDGETRERSNWIVVMSERLRGHPAFAERAASHWLGQLDGVPSHRVHDKQQLTPESLQSAIGLHQAFQHSYPRFTEIREEHHPHDELAFQVGLPAHVDLSAITLGPAGVLHRRTFRDALIAEVRRIYSEAGQDVVFQVETPVALIMASSAPRALQPKAARFMGRQIVELLREFPEGARVGLHLCAGDYGNHAAAAMRDAGPAVELANEITSGTPGGLEFLHMPFAAGKDPAPTHPEFYRPLQQLVLPGDTRLVAGLVHEEADVSELHGVLRKVDRMTGRRADVATACGLGRRDRGTAVRLMRVCAELCGT